MTPEPPEYRAYRLRGMSTQRLFFEVAVAVATESTMVLPSPLPFARCSGWLGSKPAMMPRITMIASTNGSR